MHNKRTIDRAVKMYQDGKRIVEIEKTTGVKRASLYHALNTRGLVPTRNMTASQRRKAQALRSGAQDLGTEELVAQLIATQRELAETRALLETIRRLVGETTAV